MNKKIHIETQLSKQTSRPNKAVMLFVVLSTLAVFCSTVATRIRLSEIESATEELVAQSISVRKTFQNSLNNTIKFEHELDVFINSKISLKSANRSILQPSRKIFLPENELQNLIDTTKIDSLVVNMSDPELIKYLERIAITLKLSQEKYEISLRNQQALKYYIEQQNQELQKLRQESISSRKESRSKVGEIAY